MATDNLGLAVIDPSDFVSPEPINENMRKLDRLGMDYVVAQGTSGSWWYRKWNSGRAECGVDRKTFSKQTLKATSNSNFWKTDGLTFGAFPFSFAAEPMVSVNAMGDALNASPGAFIVVDGSTSKTQSPYFKLIDWAKRDIQPIAGIYVCGKWK